MSIGVLRPESSSSGRIFRFGVFEFHVEAGELRKHGLRLKVGGQPLSILALLLERPGEVITREDLEKRLWPVGTYVDYEHSVNAAVKRLRQALSDSADFPRYIETIPRHGYRFIAPVLGAPSASAPPAKTEIEAAPSRETAEETLTSPFVAPARATKSARLSLKLSLGGAALIALFAASFTIYRRISATEQPPIKSLAVLALKNLSGDPAQEYLADGMTEELIGRLASLRGVRVTSRTSSMQFKDTRLSAPEIARTLGVDALVEGSVIREGRHIRVQAQLIRATDEHFWSEAYDREMGDVLALESEIAQSIAEKVAVTVTGQEQARLATARQISPEVYELYLKGKLGPRNTRAELEQSRANFEQAIQKDPTFAPAYVGLAKTYEDLGTIFVGASPAEMRPRVLGAAKKALELDPDLAEAHLLIAVVYQRRWQWNDAEAEYKRALQLKPSDASAHLGFATWLLCHGRTEEALAWARRARELDPLGESDIAWILFNSRRYDEAIRDLRSALAVHPDSALARWSLGLTLIAKGQFTQAIAELEKTAAIMHRSPGSLEVLAMAYGYAGRRHDALRLIDELKRLRERGYVPAGAFINPYIGLRDYDQALAGFERAYKEQSNILQWIKVEPIFDPLRGNPRFEDLVRRVGLK
jgi:TolB-like protein/DNA-binding winged helix-turn-helix (wHTH) protein/Tfp pilus assembly protein PilF